MTEYGARKGREMISSLCISSKTRNIYMKGTSRFNISRNVIWWEKMSVSEIGIPIGRGS